VGFFGFFCSGFIMALFLRAAVAFVGSAVLLVIRTTLAALAT